MALNRGGGTHKPYIGKVTQKKAETKQSIQQPSFLMGYLMTPKSSIMVTEA